MNQNRCTVLDSYYCDKYSVRVEILSSGKYAWLSLTPGMDNGVKLVRLLVPSIIRRKHEEAAYEITSSRLLDGVALLGLSFGYVFCYYFDRIIEEQYSTPHANVPHLLEYGTNYNIPSENCDNIVQLEPLIAYSSLPLLEANKIAKMCMLDFVDRSLLFENRSENAPTTSPEERSQVLLYVLVILHDRSICYFFDWDRVSDAIKSGKQLPQPFLLIPFRGRNVNCLALCRFPEQRLVHRLWTALRKSEEAPLEKFYNNMTASFTDVPTERTRFLLALSKSKPEESLDFFVKGKNRSTESFALSSDSDESFAVVEISPTSDPDSSESDSKYQDVIRALALGSVSAFTDSVLGQIQGSSLYSSISSSLSSAKFPQNALAKSVVGSISASISPFASRIKNTVAPISAELFNTDIPLTISSRILRQQTPDLEVLRLHKRFGHGYTFSQLRTDPTGRHILAADSHARVLLFDVGRGTPLFLWKGYRDASIGWILGAPPKGATETICRGACHTSPESNGLVAITKDSPQSHFASHSSSTTSNDAGSVLPIAAQASGHITAEDPTYSYRVHSYAVIFAPHKSSLEIWSVEPTHLVRKFLVAKNSRLLNTTVSWPAHANSSIRHPEDIPITVSEPATYTSPARWHGVADSSAGVSDIRSTSLEEPSFATAMSKGIDEEEIHRAKEFEHVPYDKPELAAPYGYEFWSSYSLIPFHQWYRDSNGDAQLPRNKDQMDEKSRILEYRAIWEYCQHKKMSIPMCLLVEDPSSMPPVAASTGSPPGISSTTISTTSPSPTRTPIKETSAATPAETPYTSILSGIAERVQHTLEIEEENGIHLVVIPNFWTFRVSV